MCGYCKGDVAAAAKKAGLKSLTIEATNKYGTPVIYYMGTGYEKLKGKAMTTDFSIQFGGFFVDEFNNRHQFPMYINPTKEEVLYLLNDAKTKNAVVGITVTPEPEIGAFDLSVEIENELFLIMLQENIDGGGIKVRIPLNPNGNGKVVFFGDYWGAKSVLDDFEIVKAIFIEFLTTGNVSEDLLS